VIGANCFAAMAAREETREVSDVNKALLWRMVWLKAILMDASADAATAMNATMLISFRSAARQKTHGMS
jgi:hypothetical protein